MFYILNMAVCKHAFTFILLTFLTGFTCGRQNKCISQKLKSSKPSTELSEGQAVAEYTCPRDFDPQSFTECCNNENCCEASFLSIPENYEWFLMITAISVITLCTVLTVLVVVCCFWSKCPLYNTCKANYNTSNVIVYSLGKDDPTPLMPAEANRKGQYHSCTVKIRKMQEI